MSKANWSRQQRRL